MVVAAALARPSASMDLLHKVFVASKGAWAKDNGWTVRGSLVHGYGQASGEWLTVQKLQSQGAPHVLFVMEATKNEHK